MRPVMITLLALFLNNAATAGKPLWTFTPNPVYPPDITLTKFDTAYIEYTITNQSQKQHTLTMRQIAGITQITAPGYCQPLFTLNYLESCTLRLEVTESKLQRSIYGGPVVCDKGNVLQCYQPANNQLLNIQYAPQNFVLAGMQNGTLFFSTDKGVNWQSFPTFPSDQPINGLYATKTSIYAASADGKVYYSNDVGNSWISTTSPDDSALNTIFLKNDSRIYVGTQSGNIFFSDNNGSSWTPTPTSPGGAINGIYLTANRIYVGSANGNIYYSNNNGAHWNSISGPNPNAAVRNIFIANGYLYINTHETSSNTTLPPDTINFEYAYRTKHLLSSNPDWTLFAQISYTLFVNNTASSIYAATQNGHIFSLITGDELGFISYSPITSLFFFG